MLNAHLSDAPLQETVVYVLEARKEVRLDFADVNAALDVLTKLIQGDFWSNR